jgi:hypothetical protein
MEKPKYKLGQKVKCIGTSEGEDGDLTYGGTGWKLDKIFTIKKITFGSTGYIYWPEDDCGVWEHHLKALRKEKPQVYGIVKFLEKYAKI